MLGCRSARRLIVQGVYEDLHERDRRVLGRHLGRCAACRDDQWALERLARAIPRTSPVLDTDLAPVLARRLSEAKSDAPAVMVSLDKVLAGAAVMFVAAFIGVYFVFGARPPSSPDGREDIQVAAQSPVESAMEQAASLSAQNNFSRAYITLTGAAEAYPNDANAGKAWLTAADIAFEQLHWYPESYEAYNTLRTRYGEVWRGHIDRVERFDMLDESRVKSDFASLHALDAARRAGLFDEFERVVGRYPGTYVASAAVEDMARISVQGGNVVEVSNRFVYAMETALSRCTNPVAAAQIKVELGHVLSGDPAQAERAQQLFKEVVDTGHPVLAQLAQEQLTRLPAP